jgi:Domain of unknown function (DUF6316)
MKRKTDETERTVFRTDRFFISDGSWFFTTREGGNLGPYKSHEAAQQALVQYLLDRGLRPDEQSAWDRPGTSN